MSYNQGTGVGGAYPHHTTNPGVQSTGMYGAGTDSNYVLPPQNLQSTGGTTGVTGTHPGMMSNQTPGVAGTTPGMMGNQTGTMGTQTGMMGQQTGAMGGSTLGGVVVGQQYVSPTVTSFAVSKKKISVSKGDWNITNQAGHTVYKVDGRIASIRDKRVLRDAGGNHILTMKKKLVTMHDTWQICTGNNDQVLATVKKSSIVQFRTAMDVMLASSLTGKHNPDYQIKGDFFDRNLTIFHEAEQAALVTRQITFTSMVLDKDTFGVTVFPGVDHAFILALIVIMDEVFLHNNGDSD